MLPAYKLHIIEIQYIPRATPSSLVMFSFCMPSVHCSIMALQKLRDVFKTVNISVGFCFTNWLPPPSASSAPVEVEDAS